MKQCFLVLFISVVLSMKGWGQQLPGGFPAGFGGRQAQPGSFSGNTGSSNNGIDDSTKVIYGPKSTRYVLEDDIFNNRRKLYTLDTTMDDVHRFTYVQRNQNLYQDLGSLGTPMRSIYLPVPQQLGAQPGYSVFSPYAFQTMDVKYFDTKSPFTDMYLALGGNDQNILRFDMAQNISPRWNAGFNVQRFTAEKQFGTSGSANPFKFLAQNWGVLLHTNYRSKNDKYTLLAHFINMNHSVDEQGGVLPGQAVDGSTIVYNYTGDPRLRSGSSAVQGPHGWEIRNDWHAYHQYVLQKGFQLYHRFDYQTHRNFYQDDTLALNRYARTPTGDTLQFYPDILGDTSRIEHKARFRLLENQFGIKGVAQFKGASFNYRAYLRIRNYRQQSRYNISRSAYNEYETPRTETFVGGWAGYYFPDSLSRFTAEAELGTRGSYRVQGQLESKFLTAGGSILQVEPTLLQERFQSKVYFWNGVDKNSNPLTLRNYYHAYGKLNLGNNRIRLQPQLDYYLVKNFIYFDTAGVVTQEKAPLSIIRTGLGYHFQLGKFLIAGQGFYTVQSGPDVLRQPPFFMNTRIQFEFLYAKVLYIQTGVDLHYKSPYYADAYMPLTQQFYLQNRQMVEGYILADVYANLRINRTRLFVKLTHANQGVFQEGYFVAPDYLQLRRGFSFGVDWYLFD
ncbi:putative porin [Spirosoma sp. BT702]|uniref:Porin n=1 Tax=Spirosoma profusum TaxID=2771354 RepID=A0A926Y0C3_9BACT|nr:putative porin [Spirosoma profusum]MBD2704258.1 putative porin [Spirosoma profusum]